MLFLASLMTSSIYLTYPRIDRYDKNQGRSVSASMVRAVHRIEDQPHPRRYIVLADQNAAAVQIHDYGFKTYYRGNYFYSHPSGGLDLYRFFQKMVEEVQPTREIATAAMDFAGVDELYLVVPDYWKTFRRVVSIAKQEADDWTALDDGKIIVFRFTK